MRSYVLAASSCLLLGFAAGVGAAPFAYVANRTLDEVTVIDTATDSASGAILLPSGTAPQGVAVAQHGRRIYVGATGSSMFNVSIADAATNTVVRSLGVLGNTIRLAENPAGTEVWAAGGSLSVKIINAISETVSGFVVSSGQIVFPEGVAFTPDGAKAYVTNVPFNNVAVVDAGSRTVSTTVSAGYRGVAVTLDGTRVFVGGAGGGFLAVAGTIDVATDTQGTSVPVTDSDLREVAMHPDGARVYISRATGVSMIDIATSTETLAVPIGTDNEGIDVHPDGTRIYLVDPPAGLVHVLDADTLAVIKSISVGGQPIAKGRFIGPIATCGDGVVTFPETCDDGNTTDGDCCSATCQSETGDPCPDDGLECTDDACSAGGVCAHPARVDATPCTADGEECTDDHCDGAGSCVHTATEAGTPCTSDGNVCTADACDGTGTCAHAVPPPTGCHPMTATKTKLTVKHFTDDTKDSVVFKWSGLGGAVPTTLGDPVNASDYTLCIGEDVGGAGTARLIATAPAGGLCRNKPCWTSKSIVYPYFQYKDPDLDPDGLLQVKMKLPPGKKATVVVKGKGHDLGAPASLTLPVVARLVQNDGSTCFEAEYDAALVNGLGLFKARTP